MSTNPSSAPTTVTCDRCAFWKPETKATDHHDVWADEMRECSKPENTERKTINGERVVLVPRTIGSFTCEHASQVGS